MWLHSVESLSEMARTSVMASSFKVSFHVALHPSIV